MATPMLKSTDYDADPTSFTLGTDDGYFLRPTAGYVKGSPWTKADAVTVIVWFHGFYVTKRDTILNDEKGEEVKLVESLKACPIKDLIFIAPWMGNVKPPEFRLDKEKHKIPMVDKDKNPLLDKKGNPRFEMWNPGSPQYREAEDKLGKAADDYLAKVLEGLANFLDSKGQALKDSSGKAAAAFTIKNLVIACHSGGGVGMRNFNDGLGSSNAAALRGCWCFDCLYGSGTPKYWFGRGPKAPPFYEYYNDTESNAKELLELMGHKGATEFTAPGANLNVIDYSKKNHYLTASEGFPERLKALKLP